MPPEPDLGRVPFQEAIDHFIAKKVLTSRAWDDMVRGEHAKAFTVAGATSIDLVNDFQKAIIDIRNRGGTKADFLKEFREIAAKHGWEYNGEESWRAKTIFLTNMRTSNAAGRLAKIRRRQAALKRRNPNATLYMKYQVLDNSLRRRPEHQAWKTVVLPVDHVWWDTHYPPNGYGCACSIRVLTARDLKRRDLKVTKKLPALNRTERVNRTTGEIYPPTPEGIDVGFDHNHVDSGYLPSGANIVDPRLGSRLADVVVNSEDFSRLIFGEIHETATVGFLSDGLPDQIGAKTNRIFLSSDTVAKQLERHPDLKIKDYRQLPQLIEKGLVIKDGAKTLVFIHVGSRIYRAAVKATNSGDELYLTSFTKSSQSEIRRMRKKGEVIREQI